MIEWLFTFLVFYLLYKLIFDFILPVSRASAQFRNKANQMNAQQHSYNANQKTTAAQPTTKPSKEDYIDFEEVK